MSSLLIALSQMTMSKNFGVWLFKNYHVYFKEITKTQSLFFLRLVSREPRYLNKLMIVWYAKNNRSIYKLGVAQRKEQLTL